MTLDELNAEAAKLKEKRPVVLDGEVVSLEATEDDFKYDCQFAEALDMLQRAGELIDRLSDWDFDKKTNAELGELSQDIYVFLNDVDGEENGF